MQQIVSPDKYATMTVLPFSIIPPYYYTMYQIYGLIMESGFIIPTLLDHPY
jgi:hypothetical protein